MMMMAQSQKRENFQQKHTSMGTDKRLRQWILGDAEEGPKESMFLVGWGKKQEHRSRDHMEHSD